MTGANRKLWEYTRYPPQKFVVKEQHGCLTLSDRGIPTLNIKETGIDKGEWVVVA
jgi:hypothetical protein